MFNFASVFPSSDSTPTKPHAPARHRHVYLRSPSPAYDPAPAPGPAPRPSPPHRLHRHPARRGKGCLVAQDYRKLVHGPGIDVPREREKKSIRVLEVLALMVHCTTCRSVPSYLMKGGNHSRTTGGRARAVHFMRLRGIKMRSQGKLMTA